MNKYDEALEGIVDLAKQYDFDNIPGSNYPKYYNEDELIRDELFDYDVNTLQEAVDKAKAFDVLMSVLNNDTFIMDTEKYTKAIEIQQGHITIVIPIQDEDYEIFQKALQINT